MDFPIYGAGSRSFKKSLLNLGSRDRVSRDARDRVTVHALREITLSINEGDRVGLIGLNGAGKSTLLRTIAGIYEPTAGHIKVDGRVHTLFSINVGIEDEATGYENILLRGLAAGMSRREIERQTETIAEFTELSDYLNLPLHTYSAGMRARLAFAISTAVEPDILLMDEWIGAGDSTFIKKAKDRMDSMVNGARVLMLASHNESLIKRTCNRVVELENGYIKRMGPVEELLLNDSEETE